MNNIGIFFKEIHSNDIFNTYCKELTLENQIEILNKIISDSKLMNVLQNIVDDVEIIKNKIEIIIEQKVKKLSSQSINKPKMMVEEQKIEKVLFYYEKTKLFSVIERRL